MSGGARPTVVVMGVSGSGKSTTALALAERIGLPMADGDAFHSSANLAKQASGVPLTDEDRGPWLSAISVWMSRQRAEGGGSVVACSCLRRAYRDVLREQGGVDLFVELDLDRAEASRRVRLRANHFMPASLVDDQFRTFEPLGEDEGGIRLPATAPTSDLVHLVVEELARRRLTTVDR